MDPDRRKRIEEIFERMLELPRPMRGEALSGACGEDEELLREVQNLLNAHERSEGLLESVPPTSEFLSVLQTSATSGERIGKYRVLEEIGRGGMGVVYRAARADGHFDRTVALKVVPWPDPELAARIVAERQILASLQHPNIARLFDGGVTEDGRPFLVMEFVDGIPIDVYCDQKRLSIRRRLELFLTVLGAVEHAHRNLVVHRDLKPSNILVTPSGEVKLLDFGIAKLSGSGPGEPGLPETRTHFRALTPEYASPEQILGETITTSSDVFSLGVVLFELLSGSRPIHLPGESLAAWVEAVSKGRPETPSDRVTCFRDPRSREGRDQVPTPTEAAEARRTTSYRLHRQLRGDLDAIVMKALRKEPQRRFGSVELFSQDIRNYLRDLPVLARRGGRWYRAGKVVSRNRAAAVGVALVTLAVLSGGGAAAWQAGIAAWERDRAEDARRQSEEVSGFLLGLFEGSDPEETLGDTVTALDLLQRGVVRAEALAGEPLVQARMLQVMSQVSRNLGRYDQASDLARKAVELLEGEYGVDHSAVAAALVQLGAAMRSAGAFQNAKAVLLRATATPGPLEESAPRVLGDALEELTRISVHLGEFSLAEELARRAVSLRQASDGPSATPTLNTLIVLGSVLRFQGRYEEAEAHFREALLRHRQPETANPLNLSVALLQLADLLRAHGGELEEAEPLYREALALTSDGTAGASRNMVWALTGLGTLVEMNGDLEGAEELFLQAVDNRRRIYGEIHPLVSETWSDYAAFLVRTGRAVEAEAIFRRAAEIDLETAGPEHTRHAGTLTGLSRALTAQGRFSEAEAAVSRALGIRIAAQGRRVPDVAEVMAILADIKIHQGRFSEAEQLLSDAREIVFGEPSVGRVPEHIQAVLDRLREARGGHGETTEQVSSGSGG